METETAIVFSAYERAAEFTLKYLSTGHLSGELKAAAAPFEKLARQILDMAPRNPERSVALRKLLEAKEDTVRSAASGAGPAMTKAQKAAEASLMSHFAPRDGQEDRLKEVAPPFADLAGRLLSMLPANEDRSLAIRKLLEARSATIRACVEAAD